MKLDLKKINPFSKTEDQKRDQAGKFTAGSGGISTLKKLNWKRSLPVVVVVALVGGFLVFRSFAGQTLYKYQYSAYQCTGFNKADIAKNTADTCVGASAEALTFRYYQGIFGRNPDAAGYKFWVQQLAGDRERPSRSAEKILATREASYDKLSNADYVSAAYKNILRRNADTGGQTYWLGQLDSKKQTRDFLLRTFAAQAKITPEVAAQKMGKPTNEEFVKQAYVGLLGRPADAAGLSYWKGQLDAKKLAPKDVIARLAIENESIKKHAPALATYLAATTTAKVDVVPTAQKRQDANVYSAAVKANEAKAQYGQIAGLLTAGRNARDAARGQAAKNPPSRAHLTAIASNQKTVQGYQSRVPAVVKKLEAIHAQAGKYCESAAEITAYSPDIIATKAREQCDKTKLYVISSRNINTDLNTMVGQIVAAYKSAEGKYEAEQRRLAAEAAARAAEEAANARAGIGVDTKTKTVQSKNCSNGTTVPVGAECGATLAEIKLVMTTRCNSLPDFVDKKRVDGGEISELMMWYYGGNGLICSTKSAPDDYPYLDCDGTKVPNRSGTSCSEPPAPAGASLPRWGYAASFDCGWLYSEDHVGHSNASKYRCNRGSRNKRPHDFVCKNSGIYKAVNLNDNYKACRNKDK